MRTSVSFTLGDPKSFKRRLLGWSQQFREIVFLDSNDFRQEYSTYDCVLAADAFTSVKTDFHNAFEDLKSYEQTTKDWLFGYLSYDLKNDTEALGSLNFDGLEFPDLFFFQPRKLFLLKGDKLELQYLRMCEDEMEPDFQQINDFQEIKSQIQEKELAVKPRISKEDYLVKIQKMLAHIHRGDIYEANFCMEFYSENTEIDPLDKFRKLNEISAPPFAAFFKNDRRFLLSASPERYLKKNGSTIISQPIKGTSPRFHDPLSDEKSRAALASDPKERAENIMIVDLVRNDLSHTAAKASVQVAELCGIYSFAQVHHMISTITSQKDSQYTGIDVIKLSFPMGSMTGAPKISAMKIIEELEETKRGLYSGAIGYFTPESDFDFNVVIRSILYNAENKYVSYSVGSAITSLSIPENEYAECLLKAKAMQAVLSGK